MQPTKYFSLTAVPAALALAAFSACDRQVDTHYQGESLLRINGSVTS